MASCWIASRRRCGQWSPDRRLFVSRHGDVNARTAGDRAEVRNIGESDVGWFKVEPVTQERAGGHALHMGFLHAVPHRAR